ncbi:MAG TPA: ABC transporter permease [Fervidobacterium sp.]|nr:ABC transporter permease [Fervidobacterium sp.]HOH53282.1 ABC transporter permease [Fervidobacterium sp.]HPC24206.1 ABC transporter permease [Fervidobacterium sp.]HQO05209.1 ABC transporter permease [Fervidobacterium sp.]HQQ17195.1 ABC transporter permease [Fervidobacterium sp.]
MKKMFESIAVPVIAVVIALVISALVILAIGKNPIEAYGSLIHGAFGNQQAIIDTLIKSTPLILTGLAVGFGFRAGVFNIGAEGQMGIGALAAATFASNFGGLPPAVAIPLTLIIGMVAGAGWAAIAGFLKAKTGAHEVVTTIMLNSITTYIASFMVTGPLATGYGSPKSPEISTSAQLPILMRVGAMELSSGIVIAILAAVFMYVFLNKTTTGYEIKAVGFNPYAAEYGGISVSKNVILAMAISGALAGLAGVTELMGVHHRFLGELAGGKGFDGISIALIGQNNPIGIIFAAILIGALRTGSNEMQFMGVSKYIVMITQAIVIFLVAADRIVRAIYARKKVEA